MLSSRSLVGCDGGDETEETSGSSGVEKRAGFDSIVVILVQEETLGHFHFFC